MGPAGLEPTTFASLRGGKMRAEPRAPHPM
jgi:hypothetical protein